MHALTDRPKKEKKNVCKMKQKGKRIKFIHARLGPSYLVPPKSVYWVPSLFSWSKEAFHGNSDSSVCVTSELKPFRAYKIQWHDKRSLYTMYGCPKFSSSSCLECLKASKDLARTR